MAPPRERVGATVVGERAPLRSRVPFPIALGTLAACVVLLRSPTLWSGLPHDLHHDELLLVRVATGIAVSGDLNPHFPAWGSLPFYGLALLLRLAAWAGLTLEPIGPASYAVARAASLAWTTGALVAIGAATARLFGARCGLLAAGLLAVSPLHAELARRALVEPWMACAFAFAGLASVRAFERGGRTRDLALAGALCGLAAAAKLTGVLALLQPLAAWGLTRPRHMGALAALGCAALASWALVSPFAWLDVPTFAAGVSSEAQHYGSAHFLFPRAWLTSHAEYARLLAPAVGVPALLAALLGLVVGLRRRPRALAVCVGAAAAHLLFVGAFRSYYERNLLVGLGAVAPLAALGIAALLRTFARTPAARAALSAALLLALLGPPAWTSYGDWRGLGLEETRAQAAEWLGRNLPHGARVLLESTAPRPLDRGDLRVQSIGSVGQAWSPDLASRAEFVVLSSFAFGPVLEHAEHLPQAAARYRELSERGRLVKRFEPEAGRSRGPTILVVELERQGGDRTPLDLRAVLAREP